MTDDAAREARPPVRILRVITRLNVGGPAIQAIELSTRLGARGCMTRLVHGALGPGEGDMRYLFDGRADPSFDVTELRTLQRRIAPGADLRAAASLFSLMRRFRPAVVHTHMAKAGTVGRLAAFAYNRTVGRRERARVVHTYHGHVLEGYFSPAKTRVFLGVERGLARLTDRIVAVSPEIRTELLDEQRIGRPDQYRVIPLGFELGAFSSIDDRARLAAREQLGIAADRHVVTSVGRLTAIKDHGLFLETARLVAGGDPAALFLVAGDGELRNELEQTARAYGIADRTRFLGWRRDLGRVYGATDVLLLTSRNEGTPVALIEALAAGVPGVSTDVGGVRDVIEEGVSGLLAPFGDARTLASHAASLLLDPARRRDMGERGRVSVVARYGIDRLVSDIDTLYRELLG
jgi:glycosyltransferase involved in cell wall biosynthesis